MPHRALIVPLIAIALAGGCRRASDPADKLDSELLNGSGNQSDAALTSALEDQITVDPALARQAMRAHDAASAGHGGSPGGGPVQPGDCYSRLVYSPDWAKRLPAGVPLYRDAKVSEAAGNDLPRCGTRIVSYATAAPVATLIRFYVAEGRRAGYDAQYTRRNGELVVGGDRPDGAAFYVTVTPRGAGSVIDIVANHGR